MSSENVCLPRMPKNGRSRAPRSDTRFVTQSPSKKKMPGPRDKSQQRKALSVGQGNLNKHEMRTSVTVEPINWGLPPLQEISAGEGVVQPPHAVPPPKDNEISLLQQAYRAFWTGVLPEERIEKECRQIAEL